MSKSRPPKLKVYRGQRPDGRWEVWLEDDPENTIACSGRLYSLLVYLLLRAAD